MEQLPWPILGAGAGWVAFLSLTLLIARAVVRGDWIPRVTHERELDVAKHDANEWRTEGRIKDQAILVELGHLRDTTDETGQTLHSFIAALQKVIDVTPRKDGS